MISPVLTGRYWTDMLKARWRPDDRLVVDIIHNVITAMR
jgi:hypothetical protein